MWDNLYADTGPERCGFVLPDDTIVEVPNITAEPEMGFEIDGAEVLARLTTAKGTWHTHPGQVSNLSTRDYRFMHSFPNWEHWIIGSDGARRYYFEDGVLLCSE